MIFKIYTLKFCIIYFTRNFILCKLSYMNTFIITIIMLSIAIFGMCIGAIFSNFELKGSCGGEKEACICSPEEREKCLTKITAK